MKFDWERFWAPVGESIYCGWSGDWFFQKDYSLNSVPTWELWEKSNILILLGDPGMGKSWEIDKLDKTCGEDEAVIRIAATNLICGPSIESLTERTEWKQLLEGNIRLSLLIDGIDEALRFQPLLLDGIISFLNSNLRPNLRAALCMRSGAWDGRRHEALFKTWQADAEKSVYEICPLTVGDVELSFADRQEHTPTEFLEWVRNNKQGPIARVPVYLEPLISQWIEDPTEAPSFHALRERQIDQLLNDPKPRPPMDSTPKLGRQKSFALSELLAVHGLLSGLLRYSLDASTDFPNNHFLVTRLCDGPLQGKWKLDAESTFDFTANDFDDLFTSGLFTRVSKGSEGRHFTFRHHTYAEHLACQVISKEPLPRVLQLLGAIEGLIPPQTLGIAVMLSSSLQPFFDWMIAHQPLALLSCDGKVLSSGQKSRVLRESLSFLETSEENIRLSYTAIDGGFQCSETDEILKATLTRDNAKWTVYTLALQFCSRCPSDSLESALWAVWDKSKQDSHLRSLALDAWIESIRSKASHYLEKLWLVANGESGTGDTHDRADAIRLLLHTKIPVRDVLGSIPKPKKSHFGSLETLEFYELVQFTTAQDIPQCLKYFSKRGPRGHEMAHNNFANKVYRLACEDILNPETSEAFASHWWLCSQNHLDLNSELEEIIRKLPAEKRVALLESLCSNVDTSTFEVKYRMPIYMGELRLLVESLPSATKRLRKLLLELISSQWLSDTSSGIEQWLIEAYENENSEFREIFPGPREGRNLRQTISSYHRVREYLAKRKQRSRRKKRHRISQEEITELINTIVDGGNPTDWIQFVVSYFYRAQSEYTAIKKSEDSIFDFIQWLAIAPETEIGLKQLARNYLLEGSRKTGHNPETHREAAFHAIQLWLPTLEEDKLLQEAIRSTWSDAILEKFNNGEDEHRDLVAKLNSFAPTAVSESIRKVTVAGLRSEHGPFQLRSYSKVWSSTHSEIVSSLILEQLSGPRLRSLRRRENLRPRGLKKHKTWTVKSCLSGMSTLVSLDPEKSKELMRKIAKLARTKSFTRSPQSFAIFLQGLFDFPDLWDELWPLFSRGKGTEVRQSFNLVIKDLELREKKTVWFESFSGAELKQFYTLVVTQFPVRNPDLVSKDFGWVTPAEERRTFEDTLLQALTSKGEVEILGQILSDTKASDREKSVRWQLGQAKECRLRKSWRRLNLDEISRLLRFQNSQLVRTERDLQQAIIVSLSRYQEWIGQKGRNINDCWESQGGRSEKFNPTREESLSLRIEDHLTSDLRLVVAREEEIRVNNRKGRTDITVSMTLSGRVLRVIIEHKRAHNPEVLESLDAQLIERYLKPSGCQTGIYLVSWFDGMAASQNKITNLLGAKSIKEARTILQNQASSASAASDRDVESFVLDCSEGDRPA